MDVRLSVWQVTWTAARQKTILYYTIHWCGVDVETCTSMLWQRKFFRSVSCCTLCVTCLQDDDVDRAVLAQSLVCNFSRVWHVCLLYLVPIICIFVVSVQLSVNVPWNLLFNCVPLLVLKVSHAFLFLDSESRKRFVLATLSCVNAICQAFMLKLWP